MDREGAAGCGGTVLRAGAGPRAFVGFGLHFLDVKLLLLFVLPLAAQERTRIQPGLDTIRAANLRADLTFLASDAMEGRMSLERGADVATQWIAAEFSKAGLKPAFEGDRICNRFR